MNRARKLEASDCACFEDNATAVAHVRAGEGAEFEDGKANLPV